MSGPEWRLEKSAALHQPEVAAALTIDRPGNRRVGTAEKSRRKRRPRFRSDRRGGLGSALAARAAQSYPQTLRVAVLASLRILYWTVTPVRRPLRPGASFAAVCPPDFRTPRSETVSSRRLSQWRTTFSISTSAPSAESFTHLTSFSHRFPSLLMLTLGSTDLIVCSPSTNHCSAALALHRPMRTTDATMKGAKSKDLLHFLLPSDPRPGA